ncbi:undecaprenyl/decaprenyl-phosphate alpha-N-acetylglucosaminyl 1-phosphate transferase [candidate division KSB1 bacterium]|nr:undecaprenyl/decaprenyl-phosphate alpha-N-acetylglucosaminyl 1-phosphate transferase [candidate division KSB1 bacterium]
MNIILYFFIPFFASLLLTPLVRRIAGQWQVYAHVNGRSIHNHLTPKWGGGAIYLSFLLGSFILYLLSVDILDYHTRAIVVLFFSSAAVFVLGAFDDKMDLGCNLKLAVELIAAVAFSIWGWRIEVIVLPGFEAIPLGWFSYPLTILWLVGVTNAINLIDGLDGLASGIIIVGSLLNMAIAALFGNVVVVWLSLGLVAAVAGFLKYNLAPASIFMGDSGSLSLGFIFASLCLGASTVHPGQIAIIVPIVLMALPLADTIWAIVRRVRKGIHPFHADKLHIHHRLVNLGFSQGGAALIMVCISFVMGLIAFIFANNIHAEVTLLDLLQKELAQKMSTF